MTQKAEVAGIEIPRPDKLLYPDDGITKADVARYYADVAEVMLPHLAGRPVNMQRFPEGSPGRASTRRSGPRTSRAGWRTSRCRPATASSARSSSATGARWSTWPGRRA